MELDDLLVGLKDDDLILYCEECDILRRTGSSNSDALKKFSDSVAYLGYDTEQLEEHLMNEAARRFSTIVSILFRYCPDRFIK